MHGFKKKPWKKYSKMLISLWVIQLWVILIFFFILGMFYFDNMKRSGFCFYVWAFFLKFKLTCLFPFSYILCNADYFYFK